MDPPISSPIACVGGASLDRRARLSGPLRPGTSNPVVSTPRDGGVARNVAEGLAHLGCDVVLFSMVGADEPGASLVAGLERAGVDTSGVGRSARCPTAAYTAVLGPGGRLEFGLADMEIFDELDEEWAETIAGRLSKCPIWFVDANLPDVTLDRLLGARSAGQTVLADPVSVSKSERLRGVLSAIDVLFPDRWEAEAISRIPVAGTAQVAAAAERILELGVGSVVVTLGPEGVFVADGSRSEALPPIVPHGPLRDVTGAGDALIGGYIYALLAGHGEPIRLGLAAASLVLEKGGSLAEGLSVDRLRERADEAA